MSDHLIDLSFIRAARDAIDRDYLDTNTVVSAALTEKTDQPVYLKLENQQVTESFKIRGALNAVRRLGADQQKRGVVCVSSGNHGRGIAYAASLNGIRAVICMSNLVPQNKINAIKALGAEVRIVGASQDEAEITADRIVAESGMTMLSPFDHRDIIAGQGTIGLELYEKIPSLSTVLAPVSGGGLIGGIAIALKALDPAIRVIGISMERGAAMHASIQNGSPVEVKELPTLADALGGGIGLDNSYTFKIVQDLVDELILVSESEIAAAIRHLYWKEKQIVEGAGSVGVAAVLADRVSLTGPTAVLISGGNIDLNQHYRIIAGEYVDAALNQH